MKQKFPAPGGEGWIGIEFHGEFGGKGVPDDILDDPAEKWRRHMTPEQREALLLARQEFRAIIEQASFAIAGLGIGDPAKVAEALKQIEDAQTRAVGAVVMAGLSPKKMGLVDNAYIQMMHGTIKKPLGA